MSDEANIPPDNTSAQMRLLQEIMRLHSEILKLTIENSFLRMNMKALEAIATIHEKVYGKK